MSELDAHEWTVRWAHALGVDPPPAAEIDAILELAGIAAHASERASAPVTCWLAAKAGLGPAEAKALAQRLAP